jgi:hypothetical protein
MRTYSAACLVILTIVASYSCTEDGDAADSGRDAESSSEAGSLDASAACDPYGMWRVTLDAGSSCVRTPEYTVSLWRDEDAGGDGFEFGGNHATTPTCNGLPATEMSDVSISSDGCTISAGSLTKWCGSGEPQCSEVQLVLRTHGSTAEVSGTYRKCWCMSLGPEGARVDVSGTATRD